MGSEKDEGSANYCMKFAVRRKSERREYLKVLTRLRERLKKPLVFFSMWQNVYFCGSGLRSSRKEETEREQGKKIVVSNEEIRYRRKCREKIIPGREMEEAKELYLF